MDSKIDQMKNQLNRIFGCILLLILIVFFLLIMGCEAIYKLKGIDLGREEIVSTTYLVNWEGRYPFLEEGTEAESAAAGSIVAEGTEAESAETESIVADSKETDSLTAENTEAEISEAEIMDIENISSSQPVLVENKSDDVLQKFLQKYTQLCEWLYSVGDNFSAHLIKYDKLTVFGNGLISMFTDLGRIEKCAKVGNGTWAIIDSVEDTPERIREKTSYVTNFRDYVESQNIPFLFVHPTLKGCQYDTYFQEHTTDYWNTDMDAFLDSLDREAVSYIDMREMIHRDFSDHSSLYYNMDHHWKAEIGLWACRVIEETITDRYGITFDQSLLDDSLYERKVYENAMFGAVGYAFLRFRKTPEEFALYFPNFSTSFHVVIPDKHIDAEGSFQDLFVNYAVLNQIMEEGGGYAYETVMYGNRPLVQITNLDNPEGARILMVRDSFSLAVVPYMALGCSQLDLIDNRPEQGNFTGSICTYIEEMKPDLVIWLTMEPNMDLN